MICPADIWFLMNYFIKINVNDEYDQSEFWQMVWEIDSPGIVMLTRLREKKGNREIEKCYRYVKQDK